MFIGASTLFRHDTGRGYLSKCRVWVCIACASEELNPRSLQLDFIVYAIEQKCYACGSMTNTILFLYWSNINNARLCDVSRAASFNCSNIWYGVNISEIFMQYLMQTWFVYTQLLFAIFSLLSSMLSTCVLHFLSFSWTFFIFLLLLPHKS